MSVAFSGVGVGLIVLQYQVRGISQLCAHDRRDDDWL